MEKYIYDQNNGLWHELQGDYYIPCLVLDEPDTPPIGMWGRRHFNYLKEHRPALHASLLLSGKLHSYLAEVDNRTTEMLNRLVKQMAAGCHRATESTGSDGLGAAHEQHP